MSAIDLLTSLGFTVHPTTLNDGGPKSHIPCGDYIYISMVKDAWEIRLYASEGRQGIRINWVQENPNTMPSNSQKYHGFYNNHHLHELLNDVGVTCPYYKDLTQELN